MIGIDEVGRGSWAGPLLVVAARSNLALPLGLKDSKKLTKERREFLHKKISGTCSLGEGWVTPAEVDSLGLTVASKLGVERALESIYADVKEEIIIDGNINYCSNKYINSRSVVKADDLYPIVSAASIYAKVERDKYMSSLGEAYKNYEFHRHVGYGTKRHSDLLKIYGISDIHRLSFTPIKNLANLL